MLVPLFAIAALGTVAAVVAAVVIREPRSHAERQAGSRATLSPFDPRLTFGTSAALTVAAFVTAMRATARDRRAPAGLSP